MEPTSDRTTERTVLLLRSLSLGLMVATTAFFVVVATYHAELNTFAWWVAGFSILFGSITAGRAWQLADDKEEI